MENSQELDSNPRPSSLLFVHGFGVDWDDRGLFPEVASWFPDHEPLYTRLNDATAGKALVALPFSHQAGNIKVRLAGLQAGGTITAICHSQGCLTAALAQLKVDKAILLAPPLIIDVDRKVSRFAERSGSRIDVKGISVLTRANGDRTLVGSDCWQEMERINPAEVIRAWSQKLDLVVIRAGQDEIIDRYPLELLREVRQVEIPSADHNFVSGRPELRSLLENEVLR